MKEYDAIFVVEGKNDVQRLSKLIKADFFITGGLNVPEELLTTLKELSKKKEIVVFTDPDSPGNRIRNEINRAVPGCLNAFIDKKAARTDHKVGIEHAAKEDLEQSLANLIIYEDRPQETISANDLYELGLTGSKDSAKLREKVGNALHIGFGNAKTMLRRLNCLGITKEELVYLIQS